MKYTDASLFIREINQTQSTLNKVKQLVLHNKLIQRE